ncbi:MAG: hypothetical protein AB7P14_05700 [Blastocatellales bacterium]
MPAQNLFDDLKKALSDFKTFLDDKKTVIKPAIAPLNQLTGGRVTELLDKLIELLNKLKEEVTKLDPAQIPGLADVTTFTQSVKTLLETSKNLLPDQTSTINDVLSVVDVVGGLQGLTTQVKQEVLDLLQAIIGDLQFLKS